MSLDYQSLWAAALDRETNYARRIAELADTLAEATRELGHARAVLARRATHDDLAGAAAPRRPAETESPSGSDGLEKSPPPALGPGVVRGGSCPEEHTPPTAARPQSDRVQQDAGGAAATACAVSRGALRGAEVWLVYDSDDEGGVWESSEANARAMTCPGESYAGGMVVRAVIQRGET